MLVLFSLLGWTKHGEVSTFEEQALTYRERRKERDMGFLLF